ncbi:hypothetical protein GGX14DRAFT_388262 [Mycena pura]|uniref:Uncharacterized protein n=1 Tax=Mycena pura TaxID=153505 RepID=A0AAD7E097_9AGAR|nr:hypothetical protein GGX14DRAFT_388262 [Mycena pura]
MGRAQARRLPGVACAEAGTAHTWGGFVREAGAGTARMQRGGGNVHRGRYNAYPGRARIRARARHGAYPSTCGGVGACAGAGTARTRGRLVHGRRARARAWHGAYACRPDDIEALTVEYSQYRGLGAFSLVRHITAGNVRVGEAWASYLRLTTCSKSPTNSPPLHNAEVSQWPLPSAPLPPHRPSCGTELALYKAFHLR